MLAEQIRTSLKADDTEANRRNWALYIVENDVDVRDLLVLLDADRFTVMRFCWMIGGLVESHPERVRAAVTGFFAKRQEIVFPDYKRSLAKMCWLAGIPETIEGEVVDELFRWILAPDVTKSAKTFAVLALFEWTKKHEDLKQELKCVIEDQLYKNGTSFEKRAGKLLLQLKM